MQLVLIYIIHVLAWWCLSALMAIIRGQGHGAMRHASALGIAVFSTALHVLIKYVYFS